MRVRVIDSHTGGEPTRTVITGGPDLGHGPMAERLERFRDRFDTFRSAVVNEPRGSDAMVGALLCEPQDTTCTAGVIFFNNVGYLGMCGHGTIGLIASLRYLDRIQPGHHRIETPAGIVGAQLHPEGDVTVANVASFRLIKEAVVDVPGFGTVIGDVAWGGNWFFLVYSSPLPIQITNIDRLTDYCWRVREALRNAGVTGSDNREIDHIELFDGNGRNFVLCPGKAYDRSPCGTGTSAKLACLYADGKLQSGKVVRQESVIGSVFEGSVSVRDGAIYPQIRGSAFVTADAELLLDERDPFCWGIRP